MVGGLKFLRRLFAVPSLAKIHCRRESPGAAGFLSRLPRYAAGRVRLGRNFRLRCRCAHTRYAAAVAKHWLATLGLALVPATAMSSGPFDGSWSVVVACAQAPDGAKAYRWNFTAQVRDGSFLGQYNQPGSIPSGTLSGQIQPTGNAHLTMDGLTGDPDYSLSRVHAGTPIHYTATAQFTARSGTGTRDQARHCDLAFSKI